jgi:hypothetical protein
LRIQRCMFKEKRTALCRFEIEWSLSLRKATVSNKQVAEIRPSTFILVISVRCAAYRPQSRTHSKSKHHDRCSAPSAVIVSGVPRGTPSFSFRARLFCSKLRMPSRPHRDIIVLSYGAKVEWYAARNMKNHTSSQGEPMQDAANI